MPDLKEKLDALYHQYQRLDYLASDPVEFVHRYSDPRDQEVVAVMAALCAYGGVKQIRSALEHLFAAIHAESGTPSAWIDQGAPAKSQLWKKVGHRFNPSPDWKLLGRLIHRSWNEFGSVGAELGHILAVRQDGDLGLALSEMLRKWEKTALLLGARASVQYFLTRPERGSACKRWMMLLRWMVRRDAIDLGIWQRHGLTESQLVMPLDTHTGRISQYLGFTSRKTLDWRAAVEVTEALRVLDADPVKYDFALSRLGILDLCQKRLRVEICSQCALQFHCTFTRGK